MTDDPEPDVPLTLPEMQAAHLRAYGDLRAAQERLHAEAAEGWQTIARGFGDMVRRIDRANAEILEANACLPEGAAPLPFLTFDGLSELFLDFGFTIRRVALPAPRQQ